MLRFPLPAAPDCVAFTPDGRLLLVGGRSAAGVRLFDSFTGRLERVVATRGGAVWVAVAPDGLRLAASGIGGPSFGVSVGSLTSGRLLCDLPWSVAPPAFLPDGKRLLTVGGIADPGEADPEWFRGWFWAALSGNRLADRLHLAGGPLVRPVGVFARPGEPVTVVQADRVRRFDPAAFRELPATRLPDGLEANGAAAVAGGVVVAAERAGRWAAKRWAGLGLVDADGFRPVADWSRRPKGTAWAASPDGRLAVRAENDRVETFDLLGGHAGGHGPGLGPVLGVAVSADGLRVAAVSRAGVAVWDAEN